MRSDSTEHEEKKAERRADVRKKKRTTSMRMSGKGMKRLGTKKST